MARKSAGGAQPSATSGKSSITTDRAATDSQSRGSYRDGVLLPAMASALVLWAAFAPLGWSWLAWLAPLGWLLIVAREQPVGRGGYVCLWLAGCLFWLLILHGIRLAYWPLYFGWLALSLYLAIYIPLFVGIARWLRRRWKFPLMAAAPIAWVGMELVRSYLLSGFAGNTLAHSQVHSPLVIQIADQVGGGGVSLVMMLVCAAVLQWLAAVRRGRVRQAIAPIGIATLMFVGMLGYGWWKLAEADRLAAGQQPLLRVLLVQENTPTIFEYNPERNQLAWTRYLNTTRQAAEEFGVADLVVWPESTFTANEPWMESRLTHGLPAELKQQNVDEAYFREYLARAQQFFEFKIARLLAAARGEPGPWPGQQLPRSPTQPHLLVGCDAWVYRSEAVERYNAALFIGPDGKLIDRYSKMHLVMFGEYIPLGWMLKWLGDAFQLTSVRPGTEVKSFQIGTVRVAPSICFESMVPHFLAGQVRTLVRQGRAPDVLINITNDSWFRGSSALDHHLASSILAAVENRRPMLVAANTGLSAHVDGAGRVLQVSQRLQTTAIMGEPTADGRWGLVQFMGYPIAWICGLISGCAVLHATLWRRLLGDRLGGTASVEAGD